MRDIDFGKGAMMNLTRLKEQDYDLVLTTSETLNFISDLEGFLIDEMQEFSAPKGFYWNEFVKKKLDETVYDWHCNPLAALPQYILISDAKK